MDLFRDQQKRQELGLRRRERPIGPLRDAWIAHRERQRKALKTIEGGATTTGHLVDFLGAGFPIEDVADHLQPFFDTFLDAGYGVQTMHTWRRALSAFFSFAELEPNPAKRVQLPHPGERRARAWSPEELVAIRHAADAHHLRLAVELALATGARQAELWAIEAADLHHDRRTVFMRRQFDSRGNTINRLKGKKARVAVVLPTLWDHLPDRSGLVLTDGEGQPVKPRQSRDLLLGVLEAAGVHEAGVGWHRFRHTYARLFLEAGGWMDELQRSLGHASIQTTEQLYGHFAPDKAAGYAVARIYGGGRHLRAI